MNIFSPLANKVKSGFDSSETVSLEFREFAELFKIALKYILDAKGANLLKFSVSNFSLEGTFCSDGQFVHVSIPSVLIGKGAYGFIRVKKIDSLNDEFSLHQPVWVSYKESDPTGKIFDALNLNSETGEKSQTSSIA